MSDPSVHSDTEYTEGSQGAQNTKQWCGQHCAGCGQFTNIAAAIPGDFVRNPEIGHQPDHARDLESSNQQIERHTILVNRSRVGHGISPLSFQQLITIL